MLQETINWIIQNKEGIYVSVTSVIVAATAIAKLTPTQEDDKWIEKVRKFFEKISNMFLPDLKKK